METRRKKHQKIDSETDANFTKQQLEQAIRAGLEQITLLIQILTVLAVANVTIVGYAIDKKSGGILFVGGFIPIAAMYILYRGAKFIVPIVYSAAILEDKLGMDKKGLLVSTFIEYAISPEYLLELKDVVNIVDSKERISELQRISSPRIRSRRFNVILGFISCVQFVSPFYLSFYYGWKLF